MYTGNARKTAFNQSCDHELTLYLGDVPKRPRKARVPRRRRRRTDSVPSLQAPARTLAEPLPRPQICLSSWWVLLIVIGEQAETTSVALPRSTALHRVRSVGVMETLVIKQEQQKTVASVGSQTKTREDLSRRGLAAELQEQ
jgi:hypothetical protein